MIRLLGRVAAQALGAWGVPLIGAWVVLALLLSLEGSGEGAMGPYLALVAWMPVALIWRAARLAEARGGAGLWEEERLRDPSGARMPLAELAAGAVVLTGALTAASLPVFTRAFPRHTTLGMTLPVEVQGDETAEDAWRLIWRRSVPPGSLLRFVVDVPQGARWKRVAADAPPLPPLFSGPQRVPLARPDAEAGELALAFENAPAEPIERELARLTLLRPPRAALPRLLANQLLFFLPLLAFALAGVRAGRMRGSFATLLALALGGLAAWTPEAGLHLPASPSGWLARVTLAVRGLLPDVSGLLATGGEFESRVGTASVGSVALWLALGGVAAGLCCLRRRER